MTYVPKAWQKESEIKPGNFFEGPDGNIYFKVGPRQMAWICHKSDAGQIIRLESDRIVDAKARPVTLTHVRSILKGFHK